MLHQQDQRCPALTSFPLQICTGHKLVRVKLTSGTPGWAPVVRSKSEFRNFEPAARQLPVRRRRERPGAKICQENINAGMADMVNTDIIDRIRSKLKLFLQLFVLG
jgi:hypothetical protein